MGAPIVDQFLADTSLTSAVAMLGMTPRYSNDGEVFIDCPFCKSEMTLTQVDFLCSNKYCDFRAGNAVDLTAGILGGYGNAVRALHVTEKGNKTLTNEEATISALVDSRQLFKLFLGSLRGGPSGKNELHLRAEGWLRKKNLEPADLRHYAGIWTRKEVDIFNSLVSDYKIPPVTLGREGFALAVPFFSSYSDIGAVFIIRPGDKEPRVIRLSYDKFLWSGLLGLTRPPKDVRVTQNFALALRLIQKGRFHSTGLPPVLGVLVNPKASESSRIIGRPIYIHYPDLEPVMLSPAILASECPDMLTVNYHDAYTSEHLHPWNEYIVRHLTKKIVDQRLDNQMYHYIDSCRLGYHDQRKLADNLTYQGHATKVSKLWQHFGERVIAFSDKFQIRKSPLGYFSQDTKTGRKLEITNFTLDVTRNIVFPDRKEVLTECMAQFGNISTKLFIPTQHLDNPSKVEEVARMAWITVASGETSLPIVNDKPHFRKYIAGYLKEETSKAPTITGLAQLGWDYSRKIFRGPSWKQTEEGLQEVQILLHQEIEFLSCFDIKPIKRVFHEDLTQEAKDLIAMVAANAVRASLGIRCLSVMYDNSALSRELLGAVFSGTGQTKAYSGTSRSSYPDGCKDMPFWISDSCFGFSNVDLPVFANSNDGLLSTTEPVKFSQTASTMAFIHQRIISKFFEDGWKSFQPVSSTDNTISLMLEGSNIIAEISGSPWPVSCQRRKIDELLDGISLDHIREVFELDIASQNVVLRSDKLDQGDELVHELSHEYPIKAIGPWGAKFGMVDVNRILRNFYGTPTLNYGRFSE
jgi:hypothetical protein